MKPSSEAQLDTGHLHGRLRGLSVRGSAATGISYSARFALHLGSTMVLARLLTPEEFGLFAIVSAVLAAGLLLRDLGLTTSVVQLSEISPEQANSVFWIVAALGAALGAATLAIAPVVGWVYEEPRLVPILRVMAASFVLTGLSAFHLALYRRQMRFVAVARIDLAGAAIGIATGIGLAAAGGGVWALVASQLVGASAVAIGLWAGSPWRPGRPAAASELREIVRRGVDLTLVDGTDYVRLQADKLMVGWYAGASALGYYSKACQLVLLPVQLFTAPVAGVAISALSRLQNEPERYRRYYLRVVSMLALAGIPCVALIAVLSDAVIRVVLGEQWTAAGPVLAIIAVAFLLWPVTATLPWVYVSLGRTRRLRNVAVAYSLALLVAFAVGLPFGIEGVALAMAICNTVAFVPLVGAACRDAPIRVSDVIAAAWPGVVVAGCAALAAFAASGFTEAAHPGWTLVSGAVAAGGSLGALSLAWRRVGDELGRIVALRHSLADVPD